MSRQKSLNLVRGVSVESLAMDYSDNQEQSESQDSQDEAQSESQGDPTAQRQSISASPSCKMLLATLHFVCPLRKHFMDTFS